MTQRNLLHKWLKIAPFIVENGLMYIDLLVADTILAKVEGASSSLCALLCKLSSAARSGHMCLAIEQNKTLPLAIDLMEDRLLAENLDALCDAALNELTLFLENISLGGIPALVLEANRLYLHKNAFFEVMTAQHIRRLAMHAKEDIILYEEDKQGLNAQQLAALSNALRYPFSVITGGPGTGKTYTASAVVRAFLRAKASIGKKNITICLTAPTGRAAAHLEKSVKRMLTDMPCTIICGTLHMLLSLKNDRDMMRDDGEPLHSDLCIVDECSMLDAKLFSHFLSRITEKTTLVLMGDKDQLPPVESGSLFADLVDLGNGGSPVAIAQLSVSLRSDRKEIQSFAEAVKASDKTLIHDMLKKDGQYLKRISLTSDKTLRDSARLAALWQFCAPHLPLYAMEAADPCYILDRFDQFRVLCTMRKGPFGTEAINQFFLERCRIEGKQSPYVYLPILITKNDYSLKLFNGDIGVLLVKNDTRDLSIAKTDEAYFYDRAAGGIRKLSALMLPQFSYGFALSVHKSQGSEYGTVLIVAPEGSERFGREMLYTAVTRTKYCAYLDASDDVIEAMVGRCSRKISGLHARLG